MAHIVLSKEDMNKLTNLYLGLDFKYNVEVKLTKTYDEYKYSDIPGLQMKKMKDFILNLTM